ncbi:1780_t:CDS:1, partial [Dentiscutata erythropus]
IIAIARLHCPTFRSTEELARNYNGNNNISHFGALLLIIVPTCNSINIYRHNIIRKVAKYIWRNFSPYQKGFFTNLANRINRYLTRQRGGQTTDYSKQEAVNDFFYGYDFH